MPATFSKKRQSEGGSHAGGPLKRRGAQADICDASLGKSIQQLSQLQLPQTRSVLQFYRSLRIEQPNASKNELAKVIATIVKQIWDKARIPTLPIDGCVKRVTAAIDFWTNSSHRPQKRLTAEFQSKLDELLDIAPKPPGRGGDKKRMNAHIMELMRKTGKQKKTGFEGDSDVSDWETDYNFFIDQQVNTYISTHRPCEVKI